MTFLFRMADVVIFFLSVGISTETWGIRKG